MDRSGFVSLIGYMFIVYGYIFDQFIFDEKINHIELTSTSVILLTAMGVALYKLWVQKKE